MKVLAIQASPNERGLTSSLAQAVLKGAATGLADTELVHLNKLAIEPCIACTTGWGQCRNEGSCIIKDDFEDLRKRMASSEAIVFATPVYFGDLSESAKIFLDRLRRCEAFSELGTFSGKKAIGISSAGGSGRGAVRALLHLEDYLRRLEFDVFDLVPVTKSSKEHKIRMLEDVGRRLIENSGQ
jgi:multimeric flavodoxin WrbA